MTPFFLFFFLLTQVSASADLDSALSSVMYWDGRDSDSLRYYQDRLVEIHELSSITDGYGLFYLGRGVRGDSLKMDFFHRASASVEADNDDGLQAQIQYRIGRISSSRENYEEAKTLYHQALSLNENATESMFDLKQ